MPVQPGNPDLVGDQIPVDMVVNCVLAAAAEAASRAPGFFRIYHSRSVMCPEFRMCGSARLWLARCCLLAECRGAALHQSVRRFSGASRDLNANLLLEARL